MTADWDALRRRWAAEALSNVLAFCGYASVCRETDAGAGIVLRSDGAVRVLPVGPVALLWRGAPLTGSPPDWPRDVDPAAARFFLTARPLAEAAALDFDLAVRRDAGNPCYLTSYTERRLRVLLSRPGQEGLSAPAQFSAEGRALVLAIDRFPACIRRTSACGDPYFVNWYALTLANAAQGFLRAGGRDRRLLSAAHTALGNALCILGLEEALP